MSLCFIMYRFEVGGCESVFMEVAKALDCKIELVTVIPHLNETLLKKLPKNVKVIRQQEIPGLSWLSRLKWPSRLEFIYSLIATLIIPNYLKKRNEGDNVTYVNFSDTLSSLRIAVKAGGCSSISWLQCRPEELKQSRSLKAYLNDLRKCKKIVCICNAQKKEFMSIYRGFESCRLEVIYNPIDTKRIAKLKENSVPIDDPYVCMVSRLDERSKDFHTPIEAYILLPDELKRKYTMQIIGDGPDRNALQKFIDEKGLQDRVILRGTDTNPYKWMNNAEFFLFSSKNEGLGVVILEAMACNKLVIATNCPVGPAEILKDEEVAGILVDVGNVNEMKEAMIQVLNGEIDIERYKRNALRRLEDFSIDRFKQKLFNLFKLKS